MLLHQKGQANQEQRVGNMGLYSHCPTVQPWEKLCAHFVHLN